MEKKKTKEKRKILKSRNKSKKKQRTSERGERRRRCDHKLSIPKSICLGLPIDCRLISRWIVSNMGILLMARRGIGCALSGRVATLFSRIAQIYRFRLATRLLSRSTFRIKCSLICCCNSTRCTGCATRDPTPPENRSILLDNFTLYSKYFNNRCACSSPSV